MKTPSFTDGTESEILCPECDIPNRLVVKTNRKTGHQFLGCPDYPECTYTRPIPESWIMRLNGQPQLFDLPGSDKPLF